MISEFSVLAFINFPSFHQLFKSAARLVKESVENMEKVRGLVAEQRPADKKEYQKSKNKRPAISAS